MNDGSRSYPTSVVLGTWGLGAYQDRNPRGYPSITEACALRVFDEAGKRDIKLVDTALSYGSGRETAGARLMRWRETGTHNFDVILKIGRPVVGSSPASRLEFAELDAELAHALAIGLHPAAVLIKDPPRDWLCGGEARVTLLHLTQTCTARRLGISTHQVDLIDEQGLPDVSVQKPILELDYNAANRFISVPAAARARESGWEVWAMQPLAYGFLAAPSPATRNFSSDDWRRLLPSAQRTALTFAAEGFHRWARIAAPSSTSAARAVAWCLSDPNVTRVVIGPRSAEQFHATDEALALLADDELQAAYAYERNRILDYRS